MKFSELTAVTRVDEDTFAVDIEPSSFIVRGPNGGYLAALMLRAMTQRLDDAGRAPRSLTVHYPAVPVAGPATIITEVVRSGRSLATVTARMVQDGRPMAIALAAFSPPWPTPVPLTTPPPVPGPPMEHERPPDADAIPFLDYWDTEITIGRPPRSGSDTALSGGSLRLVDPEPVDAIVVAAMTDAWFPALFTMLPAPNPVPTIDLTVHFRTTLPTPAAPADEPVLVQFHTHTIADGFLEEDGEIWAPDGTLLAQSRQLAIVLPG